VQKGRDATEVDDEENAEGESDDKAADEEAARDAEYEVGGDEDCDTISALAAASVATCCK
jgi:hypothetical protein